LESLEARLDHLQAALEGLRATVDRQAVLPDKSNGKLRRRTDPELIARDLRDARRRGL
jgi:hypothetical protein